MLFSRTCRTLAAGAVQPTMLASRQTQVSLDKIQLTFEEGYRSLPFCVVKTTVARTTVEKNDNIHSYHVVS